MRAMDIRVLRLEAAMFHIQADLKERTEQLNSVHGELETLQEYVKQQLAPPAEE